MKKTIFFLIIVLILIVPFSFAALGDNLIFSFVSGDVELNPTALTGTTISCSDVTGSSGDVCGGLNITDVNASIGVSTIVRTFWTNVTYDSELSVYEKIVDAFKQGNFTAMYNAITSRFGNDNYTALHTKTNHYSIGVITVDNTSFVTDNAYNTEAELTALLDDDYVDVDEAGGSANISCIGNNCYINMSITDTDTTYTADEGNITLVGTIFRLLPLDLAEHLNSLNWITNAVSDLVNYPLTSNVIDWINGNRTASEITLRDNIDQNITEVNSRVLNTTTDFGGDVSGTYDAIAITKNYNTSTEIAKVKVDNATNADTLAGSLPSVYLDNTDYCSGGICTGNLTISGSGANLHFDVVNSTTGKIWMD